MKSALRADSVVQQKGARWIVQHHINALRDVESQKAALQSAQAAVKQAQAAVSLAQDYKDHQAEPVAAQALATAKAAEALAADRLARSERVEQHLNTLLKNVAQGPEPVALPADVQGEATLLSGGREIPLANAVTIQPGDVIKVGANSSARLITPDGSTLWLDQNSEFQYKKDAARGGALIDDLLHGALHVRRKRPLPPMGGVQGSNNEPLYRAAGSVAAVRGTDFDLRIDDKGVGQLTPYSGEIELSGVKDSPARSFLASGWLTEHLAAYAAPTASGHHTAALQGQVFIQSPKGVRRPASLDGLVATGEKVFTGADGVIHLDLADHSRLALGPGAELDLLANRADHTPMYVLRAGRAHLWGTGEKTHFHLLTLNSVASPQAKEFEVVIGNGGAAGYAAIEGVIEISAAENRLDSSKMKLWWNP